MGIYAEVQNSTITNTVVCDAAFASEHSLTEIDNLTPQPGIGWTTDGTTWTAPTDPPPTPQQRAQVSLQAMFTETPTMTQQIASDVALFANTPVGSTLTADHLAALQRCVNGFSTVLSAIQAHAVFTGAIQ